MTARPRIALAAAALALSGLIAATSWTADVGAQGAEIERPNIVIVVTDDQTVGQYNRQTMPKVVKKLERKGTSFEQAIVTTPLCCPSRATFITGQYAHNHGVIENDFSLFSNDESTLPVWLQGAGYRTIHVGKYMNGYKRHRGGNTVAPGWDEWHSAVEPYGYYDYLLRVNGGKKSYGESRNHYLTRVLNKIAIKQATRAARSAKPFYLQLDHYAPHIAPGDSKRCRGAAVPDPRDYDLFRDAKLPKPPSFNEADVSDKPSFIKRINPLRKRKINDLERRWGCTLASLRAVDRGTSQLIKSLDRAGELEDTVIIFVSDNGFYYGEHRIPDAKQNPYEEGIRVPLIFRVPPKYLGGQEQTRSVSDLVANTDVVATIMEFAGAVPCNAEGNCRTLDGRSLIPALAGQPDALPAGRAFAIELGRTARNAPILGGRACSYVGLRTPTHFYAHHTLALNPRTRACEPVDDTELYDLKEDPYQLESLHRAPPGSPDRALLDSLAERTARLADCAGIEGRDPVPPSGHWCE